MNLFEAREILKKNGYILKRLNECGFGLNISLKNLMLKFRIFLIKFQHAL